MATKGPAIKGAVALVRASQKAYTKKWAYMAVFLVMLFVSVSVLSGFDLLPNPPKAKEAKAQEKVAEIPVTELATTTAVAPELPIQVEIPAINLAASVANPDSTNIEVLDNALLNGAVRYPSSAKLGENGNVILFGHSSYLPIVHNKAFKTFDGIQNLKTGDAIRVSSGGTVYIYSVTNVRKANASADSIPLTVSGKQLTLATCNSFGTKSDRFIVTAEFVGTEAVPSTS